MKSYKREAAASLLAFWALLVMYTFFFAPNVAELIPLINNLSMVIVVPSLGVFGYDAHIKKSKDK